MWEKIGIGVLVAVSVYLFFKYYACPKFYKWFDSDGSDEEEFYRKDSWDL